MKRVIIPVFLCALMAMPLYAQKKKDLIKQLDEANAQIIILNQTNSQQVKEIEGLTTANSGLEEENLKKIIAIKKLQIENSALCDKNSELCGDIDSKTADIEQLKKDNEKLKAQIKAKNAVILASEREKKYDYPFIKDDLVFKILEKYSQLSNNMYCYGEGTNPWSFFKDLYAKSGSGLLVTEADYAYVCDTYHDIYKYTFTFKYTNNGKVAKLNATIICD